MNYVDNGTPWRLLIIHYHLNPGGVTSVITLGVKAILNYLPEVREITLLAGDASAFPENLRRELSGLAAEKGAAFEVAEDPELAYRLPEPHAAPAEVDDAGRALAERLLARWGGAIWWVHNYHIAKNPILTQALLRTGADRPEQPLLFQIHDFPESGRPENLSHLEKWISLPLYPVRPGVHYGVINRQDYGVLKDAGVPEGSLSLLPNPVDVPPAAAGPGGTEAAREFAGLRAAAGLWAAAGPHGTAGSEPEKQRELFKKIEDTWGRLHPGYIPGAPLVFYPVRTIRRKNVLEAGLLALLSPVPFNLTVTLPGVSAQEEGFSRLVEGLFREGIIPGLWGTGVLPGRDELDFRTLRDLSRLIISTSVQEGFGYLFIDGVINQKPLFIRRLEVFDEIPLTPADYPLGFYDRLLIPLEEPLRKALVSAYRQTGAPADEDWLSELLRGPAVDFSYLPADTQKEVLIRIRQDPGYRRETAGLNQKSLELLAGLLENPGPIGQAAVERALAPFRPEEYARRCGGVFAKAAGGINTGTTVGLTSGGKADKLSPGTSGAPRDSRDIEARVRKAFRRGEYRRLLLS